MRLRLVVREIRPSNDPQIADEIDAERMLPTVYSLIDRSIAEHEGRRLWREGKVFSWRVVEEEVPVDKEFEEWKKRRDNARQKFTRLTSRQIQVVKGISRGLTNKAIARELGLSIKTVEKFRMQVMERLNLESTMELLILIASAAYWDEIT